MVKRQYYVVTELLRIFAIFVNGDCCFGAPLVNHTAPGRLSLFVVGGELAYPDQFPYTVSIQQLKPPRFPLWYHFCGGTIIAPRYVLTAAHCFANRHLEHGFLSTYRVVAGSVDLSKDSDVQQVKYLDRIYLAAKDMPSNNPHLLAPKDVALIRLTSPYQWSIHVQPMDLPRSGDLPEPEDPSELPNPPRPNNPLRPTEPPSLIPHIEPFAPTEEFPEVTTEVVPSKKSRRRTAIMSGFGAIKDIKNVGSVKSSLLRYMDVPLISFDDCVNSLRNQTSNYNNSLDLNDNFCTGTFMGTQEACVGDSGGPLITMTDDGPVIIGVVSFGMRPCGYFKNAPTVYTNVSRFVPWIKDKMWFDEASWIDYMIVITKGSIQSIITWIRYFFQCVRKGPCVRCEY